MVQAEISAWEVQPDGRIQVTWLDGHSNLFLDLQEIRDYIAGMDTDPTAAERLVLGWFLARSADASNTNLVVGKLLTFDMTAANPIRVQ